MKKLRILLVSHDFSVTGAPNSLLRQAKYFKAAGHDVDVWSLGNGPILQKYIDADLAPIIIEDNSFVINSICRHINKKYDFVLCNTIVTYNVVKALSRYSMPIVWFIRETRLLDEWMKSKSDFARVFKNFYNLYTVSEYSANVIRKYNSNVRVLNNAIDDMNLPIKPTTNKIVFGYIGSLIEVKGVEFLIDSFIELSKKYKNIELLIAGDYTNPYAYRTWLHAKTSNIKNIKWLGLLQNKLKQKFFDSIDVLCVPSLDEPGALTVIEGAMESKVLITTENTGTKYLVRNGHSGYVVKPADSADLLRAMKKVMNSDIDKMKAASRKMYLKYGTTDRENRDVLNMLYDNIDNRPPVEKLGGIFHKLRRLIRL